MVADGKSMAALVVFGEGLSWEELELPFEMDEDLSAPPRRLISDVPEDEGEQLLLF